MCHLSLSNCSELVMYADDLVLYKPILDWSTNISAINSLVEENHLTFNNSKCKCMLLTHRSSTMPDMFLSNILIEMVTCDKYLGVLVTSDLKWNTHISNVCQRAKRLLGCLYRKVYKQVNSLFLLRQYLAIVRPVLEYASIVWDPHTQQLKSLESVQKFPNLKTVASQLFWSIQSSNTLISKRIFEIVCSIENCVWLLLFPPTILMPVSAYQNEMLDILQKTVPTVTSSLYHFLENSPSNFHFL